MITHDLMSLNSHKSFKSLSLFLYSLKRQRRKVGLVMTLTKSGLQGLFKVLGQAWKWAEEWLVMPKHTQKEREREREGLWSSALSQKKFIECWLVFVYHKHFYKPENVSKSGSAKAKYFSQMQWSPAGHSEGVRGPRWLMKHTGGGGLTSLRKSLGSIQWSEVIYSVLKPSLHFSCYYFIRTGHSVEFVNFIKMCIFTQESFLMK